MPRPKGSVNRRPRTPSAPKQPTTEATAPAVRVEEVVGRERKPSIPSGYTALRIFKHKRDVDSGRYEEATEEMLERYPNAKLSPALSGAGYDVYTVPKADFNRIQAGYEQRANQIVRQPASKTGYNTRDEVKVGREESLDSLIEQGASNVAARETQIASLEGEVALV